MDRAYSLIEVKSVDEGRRIFRGWATTPAPDRMADTINPLGATFKNPLVLLHQHRHDAPIGSVKLSKPTAKGIEFEAEVPVIDEPGPLKDRVDTAWGEIKHGLVKAVSIGFRPVKYAYKDDGGIDFQEVEIIELSSVSVPANSEATITIVRSIDAQLRAASGNQPRVDPPPGVAGEKSQPASSRFFFAQSKGTEMKTIAEQIAALEAARAAKAARMSEIMQKSMDEGRSTDEAEREEFDNLDAEVKTADGDLARLRKLEKLNAAKATPVAGVKDFETASQNRGGSPILSVRSNLPKGIGFARFAMAMFAGKGDVSSAKAFAENAFPDDDRLQNVMKAAVAAGTTTSPTWAGNLVDYQNLSNEFIEFLRPRTIVGQFGVGNVPALRRVPFNVRIPGKTGSGTAAWVGEGYAKPVTASSYEPTELKWSKIAAISVITEELARFADPAVQTLVRDDLAEAVIERIDVDFINPAKAAGTGAALSPPSITNGVTAIPSAGVDAAGIRADIAALWATADATNLPTGSAVYITDSKTARMISMLRNPLGGREFGDVTMSGGSIDGVPLIVSNYVPSDEDGSLFILAFASEIYLADDGVVTVDVSREASIFMDSTPNSSTPTTAQLVSMFQTNQLAIRAERYIHWKKRRPQAVAYLSGVKWGVEEAEAP
jgi:HK97 family phage major capsid protein/HK97 family phage prohead protease